MSIDMTELADALSGMADVLGDGLTASHVGDKFTCTEAETLAHVLRVAGFEDAAETWLKGHAEGDDWCDEHYARDDEEGD